MGQSQECTYYLPTYRTPYRLLLRSQTNELTLDSGFYCFTSENVFNDQFWAGEGGGGGGGLSSG